MNWYVGQKVVCVNASDSPLRLHATYVVAGLVRECGCGPCLDVGINLPPLDESGTPYIIGGPSHCLACGCDVILRSMAHGFRASRFRPLDSLTEQLERIETEGALVEQPEPQHA